MKFATPLPIDDVLDALQAALAARASAVLVAPPGAGKTTRVPLALMDEKWLGGRKVLVLEPRRIAARAAAERMAATLSEAVGERIGLRARMVSKSGPKTRIEVVTEGVFTRMILDDPELSGVGAVLFDEFHERSLDADLGLALALDCQRALRDDLRILPMSATLDGARVARLLGDAPVIESEGRAFPVETRYLGRDANARIEDQMADAVMRALRAETGSILAFLPGQGEIRRVEERLKERIADPAVVLAPLYGAMDAKAQDLALEPARAGLRKIVLATSIAETSITIEGVRVVIDCGLARVPRFEPDVGVTRLETVRVSRAAADQRWGRAGRTAPGVCYRLWDEPQTQSLPAYAEPEIRSADLSGLLLDCAEWGATDPLSLSWIDPPPAAAMDAARAELTELEALDAKGRITDMGKRLRSLPLPPRLARMVIAAAELGHADDAAEIAALMVERGLGGNDADLAHRLEAFRRDRSRRASDMRKLAAGWARMAGAARQAKPREDLSLARILALAFPERIAKARGAPGQFLLANGRGANLEPAHSLARSPYIVAAELSGSAASTRILLAAVADEADVLAAAGHRIREADEIDFDPAAAALRGRRVRRLDAILLGNEPRPVAASEATSRLLAEGIAKLGLDRLPWSKSQLQLRHRVGFLRAAEGEEWPDLSDAALGETAAAWLAPFLDGKTKLSDIGADDLGAALDALLPWSLKRRVDDEAPTHFEAPTGNRHAIDYETAGAPALHIRVQELFGLTQHPSIAGGRLPLTLHLLSPAHRPIQITRDLPGFWRGSWAAVKAEMKGRYPRHPWPDDPAQAAPTSRAKPRGT
ncbi:ATP-dependent helicase HrpB [Rhodomicrobium vannielii ATCC 17100]|uniref:ATP-dependent helicase HrpB n=1 Tax=Rhodomicrobium vannielii (strain ATCC 17100 / DSM 162 / LMG 4299 / NCIMB 10020 / ATH 3.1.1) TaxID=648757 RepID=E3I5I5_RHOVT|nr:ATP-dependent helicase HrpB [Rhodomicrobium vannielii]ADP72796.1 ATP-dependent helicase HrpB [Rhodomicrobium vannielii ATCC 17100]